MYDYAQDEMNNGALVACNRTQGSWTDNMSAPHYHEFYEMYFQESGVRNVFFNGTASMVTPGMMVIYEPYLLHRSYSISQTHSDYTRMLVYFKPEAVESILKMKLKDISGVYEFDNEDTAKISKQLLNMMPENCVYDEMNDLYKQSMLEVLLISFFHHKPRKQQTILNHQMSDIMNYIKEHLAEKLTIDALSKRFYISQSYLCHEFKKYTDQSLLQYVNYNRVLYAQKALITSTKPITDIAYESGFENSSTFNRVFRSVTAFTPSEFRKSHQL